MWRTVLLGTLAGCRPGPRPAEPVAPPALPDAALPVDARPPPSVHRAYLAIVDTCFYFSGPFDGRDDKLAGAASLERSGPQIRLRLGAAVFAGTLDGDELSVTRVSEHAHQGTWRITESVEGTYAAGVLRARYRYEECGPAPEPCPARCTMTADLVAELAAP
jgi:hypothetical protein